MVQHLQKGDTPHVAFERRLRCGGLFSEVATGFSGEQYGVENVLIV